MKYTEILRKQIEEIDTLWDAVMKDIEFWRNELSEAIEQGEEIRVGFCELKLEELHDDVDILLETRKELLRELKSIQMFDTYEIEENDDDDLILIMVDEDDLEDVLDEIVEDDDVVMFVDIDDIHFRH